MNIDRQKINQFANKIRLALDMQTPPYEPFEAIEKLGGQIINDIDDQYIDAFIEKDGKESFVVHLNQNQNVNRERFTLAHELGHLFLHMGYIVDQEKWESIKISPESKYFRDDTYSIAEFEANEFAASFLMPHDEFIEIAEKNLENNEYQLEPIADYFSVSLDAVSNRGKWLGIFKW